MIARLLGTLQSRLRPVEEVNRLRLGITGALVIALVATATLWTVGRHGDDFVYTAEFARADGARVGNQVRVAGVPVGEVTDVDLAGDRIVVTFRLDKSVDLGSRTKAEMKVATLLGSYYLEVDPDGSGSLPERRIPLAQTRSPFTLDDIVTKGGTDLGQLDPAKLRDALAATTDAFGDDGKRLGQVLDGITSLTSVANARQDQIRELVRAMRQTASVVAQSKDQALRLIDDSNLLLTELINRRSAVENLLSLTVRLNRTIASTVDKNAKPMERSLRNLDQVLAVLKDRDADLNQALVTLAPTMRYLSAAFGNGPYGTFRLASPLPDNVLCATHVIKDCS